MKASFVVQLQVVGEPEQIEASLDRVMEELLRLNVEDPAIGGSMETGEVEISLAIDAPSLEEAAPLAMSTIRTAVHAAEVATPNWPRFDKRSLQVAVLEETDTVSA